MVFAIPDTDRSSLSDHLQSVAKPRDSIILSGERLTFSSSGFRSKPDVHSCPRLLSISKLATQLYSICIFSSVSHSEDSHSR